MLCLTLCVFVGEKQVSLGRGGRINIWLEMLSFACQRFCVSILYAATLWITTSIRTQPQTEELTFDHVCLVVFYNYF